MAGLSSFEILAQNLVPASVAPPGLPNPLVIQGYWVQVTVPSSGVAQQIDIVFEETTNFGGSNSDQRKALDAEYIDGGGNLTPVSSGDFFGATENGFFNHTISPGQTFIFGVQAIPASVLQDVTQTAIGWRGTVKIVPSAGSSSAEVSLPPSLFVAPTHRLVYFNTDADGKITSVIDGAVYPVNTFNGSGTLIPSIL